jgi:hypothetical protein
MAFAGDPLRRRLHVSLYNPMAPSLQVQEVSGIGALQKR